jgi:hypothetical protein
VENTTSRGAPISSKSLRPFEGNVLVDRSCCEFVDSSVLSTFVIDAEAGSRRVVQTASNPTTRRPGRVVRQRLQGTPAAREMTT